MAQEYGFEVINSVQPVERIAELLKQKMLPLLPQG
jgi:hypothetical protein